MINEAVGIYADGVASVEGIDTAMKLGANHPMGPLALGDSFNLFNHFIWCIKTSDNFN